MPETPKSAYFREMHPYPLEEFRSVLGLNMDSAKEVVSALKRSGVAKAVNRKTFDLDQLTEESEVISEDITENSDIAYVIKYMGVVYTKNCVLKCYPKYIDNFPDDPKDEEKQKLVQELRSVLKAIQKHNDKVQSIHLYNGEDRSSFNMLGLVLHILHDYYENGIYTNYQEVIETNGEGEIDWDRTINETFAYLKDNRPYYLELKTIANQTDDFDYFKRLHECIVTECSKYLEYLGLTELFDDVPFVQLSESSLDDFGDTDYIKYRLEREIATQFVTRKQRLLKTLYTYVAQKDTDEQENSFSLWGTNSLNLVWEHACGEVFKNEYESFKKYIDCPEWKFEDNEDSISKETLIPDIVCKASDNTFCILDGKYYLPKWTKNALSNNPGVQDVVKQFVYHKAFLEYLIKNGILNVFNAFLFPAPSSKKITDFIKAFGKVDMKPLMEWGLNRLPSVHLAYVNPDELWNAYVGGKNRKAELELCVTEIQKSPVYSYDAIIPSLLQVAEVRADYSAQQLTMVGYLKPDYAEFLHRGCSKMIFYFYHTRNGFVYPVHPHLINCKTFAGYTDGEGVIVGNIVGKLQICDASALAEKLAGCGIEKSNFSAQSYYVIEIEDVRTVAGRNKSYYQDAINAYPGNDITHEYSPKVVNVTTVS